VSDGVLDGQVAIVTGSGKRVGRGLALALGKAGARIVVCGRSTDDLEATAAEIRDRGGDAMTVTCDVSELEDCERLVSTTVQELGRLDILINNANHYCDGRLLDLEEERFTKAWEVAPLAVFRLMRLAHPHLSKQGGTIINLVTGASLRPDPIGFGGYTATKDAVRALTRAAACEWGRDRIRVHSLAPLAELDEWFNIDPAGANAYLDRIPLGRIGQSEEDAGRVAVFLCSPDSSYMTGNTILVDGGSEFLR
jgi:meso-butanediol dehydrogenase/(S,S)-butanediol dehydrogenase/diacetyl reductase